MRSALSHETSRGMLCRADLCIRSWIASDRISMSSILCIFRQAGRCRQPYRHVNYPMPCIVLERCYWQQTETKEDEKKPDQRQDYSLDWHPMTKHQNKMHAPATFNTIILRCQMARLGTVRHAMVCYWWAMSASCIQVDLSYCYRRWSAAW